MKAEPTLATENYVKKLFLLAEEREGPCVPMGVLAESLGVAAGTITTMVKRMDAAGWVVYTPRVGVSLTAEGRKLALKVIRRHRLIESLLVDILGMDWGEIHDEAERLEHVISDNVLSHIDIALKHPAVDPHGDPIPSLTGKWKSPRHLVLHKCVSGDRIRVVQVKKQTPRFLAFCQNKGLRPGMVFTVVNADPIADAFSLKDESGRVFILGGTAASKLTVELMP